MAKKKQKINLIDQKGNSKVVEVNSSDLSDNAKKASVGSTTKKSTISSAIRGGINRAASDARNYGPLVTVANTVNGLGLGAAGSNLNKTDSRGHNLLDNALQVGKNVRAGVQSGLMSIPDSQLYEVRNSLQKGEKKAEETTNAKDSTKELLKSGGKALLYTLSPTLGQAVDNLSGNKAYDEDDNAFQRALKSANNTYNVLGGTRGLGKTVEATGQLYAENQERQGKNDKLSSKVENFQETIDKPAEDYAQQVQLENQNYSKPVQFLGNTGQTVGNMIPSMVVSAATKNPNAGLATMFLQSKGSATKEALQNGADLDEANAIGTAKGGIEVGTEKLFGGIKFKGKSVYGSGSLDDITETALNKLIKNKTANFLVKQLGVNNVGEILEETISDIAGTIIDKNTTDPNASYSMKDWGNTALQTLASTLALNLLGGSFGRTSYNENLKSMSDTEIAQMQDALIKTSPEDIQRIVSKEVESINQKVQEGKLDAEQAQLAIETLQAGGQDLMENQAALQNEYGRPQNTLESKLEIVKNLPDVEKAKLVEIHQKIQNGEQLNMDEIATLQYFNSKGTPQTVENTPIQEETTLPNAIPQEAQNVAQNREINNNYASQDLKGPPVEEERTPYSKQMTQEEADEMQRAHSESLDRMADGRVGRTPGEQLIKDNNVSDRRVNAIQYDNPEIKKYYKQAAEVVGAEAYDAKNQSFQSGIREQQDELGRTEYRRYAGWNGFISKDLSDLARNNHLTARQIEKAANDIMEDNGKENNANAKKLEKVLDKRLREGYSAYGDNFEPNQDYINEMENIAYEKQRQGELESLEDSSKTVETNETTQNNKQESTENSAFNLKEKQNEIIQNTNPMNNEYNTGIRNENDIRTWDEVLGLDDDSEGQFAWGDYTREDALRDQEKGTVTVYSSYPIENGNFVSTSKIQAEEYAGGPGSKVYSKEVPLNEVAWINGDEGQYAKVENNQQNIENQTKQENIPDKVEEQVIKIGNKEIKSTDKESKLEKELTPEELRDLKIKEVKENLEAEYDEENIPKILKNTELAKEKTPTKEKIKNLETIGKMLYGKVVDKGEALAEIGRKTGNKELYPTYDKSLLYRGIAQYQIGNAQTDSNGNPYANFKDKNGKDVSMSWEGIYKDANKAKISDNVLDEYLVAQLNIDRLNQGINQFNIPESVSQETIARLEQEHPEIKRVAENVYTYSRNRLNKMVESGLVSQETADEFTQKFPHYVRIQRDVKKGKGSLVYDKQRKVSVDSGIQHVKGGSYDILPIKETAANYEIQLEKAMGLNAVGLQLEKSLATPVDSNGKINKISENGELLDFDPNEDTILGDAVAKGADGNYTFTIWMDGAPVRLQIDARIYEALKTNRQSWLEQKITQPTLGKVAGLQRALLTDKNPVFLATNFLKDIGDAPLNSKYGTVEFFKNYGVAMNEMRKGTKSKLWQLYLANGGLQNSYFENMKFNDTGKNKVQRKVSALAESISKANNVIEQLPRFAEFITTLNHGGSLNEAMYNSAEITTNFKRGGNVTKALNRNGFNFLNASVQGFDKQVRNFAQIGTNRKAFVHYLAKATILGIAPALVNDLIYDDDDEYKELQDYVKDQYYLIKGKDGVWIRIPKGRVMSIFGAAARRTKELATGNKDSFKDFGQLVSNQIAPNNPLDNNILSPFIAVANNKAWSGNTIVSDYEMKNYAPEDQYDNSTDKFSIWLGKKLKKSPKMINYLLDQYTGGIGDFALPALSNEANNNVIRDKFTTDAVMKNKTTGEFYSALYDASKAKNKLKKAGKDNTDEYQEKNKVYSYLYSTSLAINELRSKQDEIEGNSSLSKKEKYEQVKEIQKEINKELREAIKNSKDVERTEEYIRVGDTYYDKKIKKDGTTEYRKRTKK